jgi:hypothetical protein
MHEDGRSRNFGNADVTFSAPLQHGRNHALGIIARAMGLTLQSHLDAVAVQRVIGIARINEYIFFELLDAHVCGARGYHVDHAFVTRQLSYRETVFVATAAVGNALLDQFFGYLAHGVTRLARIVARGGDQLFERERLFGKLPEHIYHERRTVAGRHIDICGRLASRISFLSLFHLFNTLSVRRYINSSPISKARSSGRNVAVCERPEARPTPKR